MLWLKSCHKFMIEKNITKFVFLEVMEKWMTSLADLDWAAHPIITPEWVTWFFFYAECSKKCTVQETERWKTRYQGMRYQIASSRWQLSGNVFIVNNTL